MNDGQKIYGVAYIPEGKNGRISLVICCHGLGGSYITNEDYAVSQASRGIAAYCFDFRGGGGSRSDGETTDMSIMTEVSDIEAILDASSQWEFVDPDQIVLLGTSQGGAASAIAAARHKDEIAGAILLYPAFLMHDEIHRQFASLDDVPDSFFFRWITLGRVYAEDIWDYDVYDEIKNYDKKVLLMHGDEDDIVPIRYSERASEVYPDADYYVIPGAGHGFYGEAKIIALLMMVLSMVFLFTACSGGGNSSGTQSENTTEASSASDASTDTAADDTAKADGNILVAYYSYTGNTEAVAKQIADLTGGDLAEIQRKEDYQDLQTDAKEEIDQDIRPEITVSVENVEDYDTIFVGYPIWWDEAPAMISTFLDSYDFSGKTIVPFCTSSSDEIDNSLHIFSEICPDANIAEGLTANDDADIEPWLQRLGAV